MAPRRGNSRVNLFLRYVNSRQSNRIEEICACGIISRRWQGNPVKNELLDYAGPVAVQNCYSNRCNVEFLFLFPFSILRFLTFSATSSLWWRNVYLTF